MKKMPFIFLLFSLVGIGAIFCEEAITAFDEKFAISVYGNYNVGIFKQAEMQGFATDEPWRVGLSFRYKRFVAFFSVPLDSKVKSFDLELNAYFEKLYFEFYSKRYQNYYKNNEDDAVKSKEDAGLDITSAGIVAGWIHNNQKHSLSSVYSLTEKQNISSGSFLYGFGVHYLSIYAENEDIKHYSERNRLIHFGPTIGYSYTWILPRDIFINAEINIGTNLGTNITTDALLFIPNIKPKMSFGHHDNGWSVNAIMQTKATIIFWGAADADILAPSTITVTFSKRF